MCCFQLVSFFSPFVYDVFGVVPLVSVCSVVFVFSICCFVPSVLFSCLCFLFFNVVSGLDFQILCFVLCCSPCFPLSAVVSHGRLYHLDSFHVYVHACSIIFFGFPWLFLVFNMFSDVSVDVHSFPLYFIGFLCFSALSLVSLDLLCVQVFSMVVWPAQ